MEGWEREWGKFGQVEIGNKGERKAEERMGRGEGRGGENGHKRKLEGTSLSLAPKRN